MILFHPRHISVLHDLQLLPGASVHVRLAALILSVALGYCAYTDLFRGRIVPNVAVLVIAAAGLASVPLIFAHPGKHLLWSALAIFLIFLILYLPKAMAAGDIKLLWALAIIFAQGTLVLVFVAVLITVIYGLPHAILRHSEAHRKKEKAGMTKIPGAPGIALSYPITLYLAGARVSDALILIAVEVATLLLCLLWTSRVSPWLEEKDEERGEKGPLNA